MSRQIYGKSILLLSWRPKCFAKDKASCHPSAHKNASAQGFKAWNGLPFVPIILQGMAWWQNLAASKLHLQRGKIFQCPQRSRAQHAQKPEPHQRQGDRESGLTCRLRASACGALQIAVHLCVECLEPVCLTGTGHCLRLAALYLLERGPHDVRI